MRRAGPGCESRPWSRRYGPVRSRTCRSIQPRRDEAARQQPRGGGTMEELTPSSIARIQELVAAGDVLRASALLDELGDTTGCPDPVLHRELGMLAEQLGQLERALAEYNQALRAAPAQSSVLRRLARLRADRGELKQAERAYRRLLELEPGDAEASLELGALLEDRGEPEQAAALYGVAAGAPGDRLRQQEPRLEQAARRLARTAAGSGAGRAAGRATGAPPGREEEREGRVALEGRGRDAAGHDEDEEGAEERAPSDADLITFSTLFSGREGVHARQWVSPSGRHGYTPVHEPFTPAVARGHLLGSYTVGIYPVRMDNTARFLAFDLDVARFALGRAGSGGRGLDGLLALSRRAAVRLIDAAASLEMVALLESSGWKGLHVWIFFAVPVPAAALRRLGQALLRRVGP
ncbi:MAG: hypothetical protein FJ125_07135, partial [Deltaproteobacteria bacterium]|nr:hypothetical protein [Deltaproteobacteria bacterium]